MVTKKQLHNQLMDAYQHLYDYAYLRSHPLRWLVDASDELPRKEQAWRLHRFLLEILDELDPGSGAPAFSREWRRHRVMMLRYADGLDPDSIASRLAISRRTFYRDHDDAIDALAQIVCSSEAAVEQEETSANDAEEAPSAERSRVELARLEVARLVQDNRPTSLSEAVRSVIPLVRQMARSRNVAVKSSISEVASMVMVDRAVLRQLLLSIMTQLVEDLTQGDISLNLRDGRQAHELRVYASGDRGQRNQECSTAKKLRMAIIEDLAKAQGIELQALDENGCLCGFRLVFPVSRRPLVLIVDDNEHTVELLGRYLTLNGYEPLNAYTAVEGVHLAKEHQPEVIVLDLMMPRRDGWDALQTLTNQIETQHIPIIICSVLAARELALSLGATLFLAKPVTESSLVTALESLHL